MDIPLRRGYAEATAAWGPTLGERLRLEAGVHPWKDVALFGFGQHDRTNGWMAGVGARWEFDLF